MKKEISKNKILISFVITTFNREKYIIQTLKKIIKQKDSQFEIIITDGANSKSLAKKIKNLKLANLRYFGLQKNLGLDYGYLYGIKKSFGKYIWLFTDDDLMIPHSLHHIKPLFDNNYELILPNAAVYDMNFKKVLCKKLLGFKDNVVINGTDKIFLSLASYLSYIGCVIFKRSLFKDKNIKKYCGLNFIHFGILFGEKPVKTAYVISKVLIKIRYGCASWTNKRLKTWLMDFPQIIRKLKGVSRSAKTNVLECYSLNNPFRLFYFSSYGLSGKASSYSSLNKKIVSKIILAIPNKIKIIISFFILFFKLKNNLISLYDLSEFKNSPKILKKIFQLKILND